ncbi:leucine-rich repeat protein [Halosquirtibacter xylanolyticus]|uniref:leucine-rich repeat protein n=1 Tax=Halosquirtibacter xylanolyticus TaxID=3374599 RepID=UPI00374808DC|nr:leucine-rich repeat protein [Prolixibacteraceae bacterium]
MRKTLLLLVSILIVQNSIGQIIEWPDFWAEGNSKKTEYYHYYTNNDPNSPERSAVFKEDGYLKYIQAIGPFIQNDQVYTVENGLIFIKTNSLNSLNVDTYPISFSWQKGMADRFGYVSGLRSAVYYTDTHAHVTVLIYSGVDNPGYQPDGALKMQKKFLQTGTPAGFIPDFNYNSRLFNFDLSSKPDGQYNVRAHYVMDQSWPSFDPSGHGNINIYIDRVAPDAPSVLKLKTASDTGESNTDLITTNDVVDIIGKAEPFSTVVLSNQIVDVAQVRVDKDGNYSAQISNLKEGQNPIDAKAIDRNGNEGAWMGLKQIVVDRTAPTVQFQTTINGLFNGEQQKITVNFSENVYGVELTDFNVINGTLSNLVKVSGSKYELTYLKSNNSNDYQITLLDNKVADIAGNFTATASYDFNPTSTKKPVATLASSSFNIRNGQTLDVNVNFDEEVVGLETTDFAVTNGKVSNLVGSGANYTLSLTKTVDVKEMSVRLERFVASNRSGNTNDSISIKLYNDSDWSYRIHETPDGKYLTLDYYWKDGSTVTVPAKIEGINVKEIRTSGFDSFRSQITRLDLSEATNLELIGESAFSYTALEEIVFNDQLKEIREEAFYAASLSGEIVLPDNLLFMEHAVFDKNEDIEKVVLGSKIETIFVPFTSYKTKTVEVKSDKIPQVLGGSFSTVFVVPDDMINDYKADRNWNRLLLSSNSTYDVNQDFWGKEIEIDGVKGYEISCYRGDANSIVVPKTIDALPVISIKGGYHSSFIYRNTKRVALMPIPIGTVQPHTPVKNGPFIEDPISLDISKATSLKKIGKYAFSSLNVSNGMIFPAKPTEISIESNAFYKVTFPKSYTLPSSVKSVAENWLSNCIADILIVPNDFPSLNTLANPFSELSLLKVKKTTAHDVISLSLPSNAKVVVPKGSLVAYQAHPVWQTLPLIEEQGTLSADKQWLTESVQVDGVDGVRVVGYKGSENPIVIPASIDGVDVLELSKGTDHFFATSTYTNGVSIDATQATSLVNIKEKLFSGITELKSIKLPSSLKNIETAAFSETGLSGIVDIPENVIVIGEKAFEKTNVVALRFKADVPVDKSNINTASYPVLVKADAYDKYIAAWDDRRVFKDYVVDNFIVNDYSYQETPDANTVEGIEILGYIGGKETLDIPNLIDNKKVLRIRGGANDGEHILLKNATNHVNCESALYLTVIGKDAFAESIIESIVFPPNLVRLEYDAFWDCSHISHQIILPSTIKYIGEYALSGLGTLNYVIPDATITFSSSAISHRGQGVFYNLKSNLPNKYNLNDTIGGCFGDRPVFFVPEGTLTKYKKESSWSTTKYIAEENNLNLCLVPNNNQYSCKVGQSVVISLDYKMLKGALSKQEVSLRSTDFEVSRYDVTDASISLDATALAKEIKQGKIELVITKGDEEFIYPIYVDVQSAATRNIALVKSATSTDTNDTGLEYLTNDTNANGEYWTSSATTESSVVLDLNKDYWIYNVTIMDRGVDGTNNTNAAAYRIETSDNGTDWTRQSEEWVNDISNIKFWNRTSNPVSGRYVKVTLKPNSQNSDINIYEIKIDGEYHVQKPKGYWNVALNKEVLEKNYSYNRYVKYLNDGSYGTQKSEQWCLVAAKGEEVIRTLDLGKSYLLKSFYIYDACLFEAPGYNIQSYKIEVSTDNADWTEVAAKTDVSAENIHSIELENEVNAQYVRFRFIGCAQDDDVRIYELEVYGRDASTPVVQQQTAEVRVYPNPASNFIRVDGLGIGNNRVLIMSITGTVVYDSTQYNEGEMIAIDQLPSGLYIVQIKSDNQTTVKKLIKR